MAGVFACLVAISALAQTEDIVVTLLPSLAQTTDTRAQGQGYLSVTASDAPGKVELSKFWLYFDASALPEDITETDFKSVRLQLTPIEGTVRGMTIDVAPAKGLTSEAAYSAFVAANATTLQSDRLKTGVNEDALQTDSVDLPPGSLLQPRDKSVNSPRYIGLVLQQSLNAGRRVYYGLNTKDPPVKGVEDTDHPDRLPRLIITYQRKAPAFPNCASEPSALAPAQADGRLADNSPCAFIATPNDPMKSDYVLQQVAHATRTMRPIVYGDGLYVVRGDESSSRLEELSPLGSEIASRPLPGKVPLNSNMVVDRFGRLRIITNDAIFSVQLAARENLRGDLPASIDPPKHFPFGGVPRIVIPGPDGTLYIVKQTIFALNPEVEAGKLENGKVVNHLEELWDVGIQEPNSARITLSPDGRYLYALGRFEDAKTKKTKSEFIAINAQTGKDVALLPKKVNSSESAIEQSDFPGDLTRFSNPVAAVGLRGSEYIFITGNTDSKTTLWGVKRNKPAVQDGPAQLTAAWNYPLENSIIGQPILGPSDSGKRLYFLQKGRPGKPKLTAVTVDGEEVTGARETAELPAEISTEGNPVTDSAGDVLFWANNTLYGFSADRKRVLTATPEVRYTPQLLFGPGGTLYAVYGPADGAKTVSALIPAFTLSGAHPDTITSPTHMQVTGVAAKGADWKLKACGSVILGAGFEVQSGAALEVKVDACPNVGASQ
jgi:hypothetical protein